MTLTVPTVLPSFSKFQTHCDGWEYRTDADDDRDVRKIDHFAIKGDQVFSIDYSPYSIMSPKVFEWYILAGFPDRIGFSPLKDDEIELLWRRGAMAQIAA